MASPPEMNLRKVPAMRSMRTASALLAGGPLDLGYPGLGDRAVGGDDQGVALAVDPPGGARDIRRAYRVADGGELGGAERLCGGGVLGVGARDGDGSDGHQSGRHGDQPGASRNAAAGGGALVPH